MEQNLIVSRRLLLLTDLHLAAGVGSALVWEEVGRLRNFPFDLDDILMVPSVALAMCQAVLLAVWLVFSPWPLGIRLRRTAMGVCYLWFVVSFYGGNDDLWITAAMATVVMGGLLLLTRRLGYRIRPAACPETAGPNRPIQFSIQDLLTLTLVVAAVATTFHLLMNSASDLRQLCFLGAWILMSALIGLCALWLVLGNRKRWAALGALLSITFLIAAPMLGLYNRWILNFFARERIYVSLIMPLQFLLLVGSLGVVRSCGFRLVRGE